MSKWLYTLKCPDGRIYAMILEARLRGDAEAVAANKLWVEARLSPLDDDPAIEATLVELANA